MLGSASFLVIDSTSWILGFILTIGIYFVKKTYRKERGMNSLVSKSMFNILLTDFWFEGFFTRKVVSFVYFLMLILFNSTVVSSVMQIDSINYQYTVPVFASRILSTLLLLIGIRIILELAIALIKLTENSSVIKESLLYYNQNSAFEYSQDISYEMAGREYQQDASKLDIEQEQTSYDRNYDKKDSESKGWGRFFYGDW